MSFNFGNFDFNNIDLSGLNADYFANLANTAAPAVITPAVPVAPVAPAPMAPIAPADRTTSSMFGEYVKTPVAPVAPPAPVAPMAPAPVEEIVSLASSFNQEDPFTSVEPAAVTTSPYYGVTEQQRADLNKQAEENLSQLPTNEAGLFDLTSAYKDYSDKLASGDLSFLKEGAQKAADITSNFKYGLDADQQQAPWSKSTAGIMGEAVKNLNQLKSTDPEQFQQTFQSLTKKPALAFLYDQAQKGEITQEEHAQSAFNFLRKEQPNTPFFVKNSKVYSYATPEATGTPREVILTPSNVAFMPAENKDEAFYNLLGTVSKKPSKDFDTDAFTGFLNNPVVNLVGAFLPPVAVGLTVAKAANGQTLHAGDWLKLANAGLSEAGVIKPPSAGAGGMGPVDNGVGLFGTTYDQTQNIMEAAAAVGSDGNPAEILIKGFGVTDDVLDKIGIDSTTFDNSIVDYDAFVEGVEEAASRVAGGDNIEEALKAGTLDYIVETAPDIDLGVVTDAVKAVGRVIDDNIFQPIIETVGDIDLGDFEDTVKDLGREFDDEVLQEIKGGIETFAPQVEDFVKTVGGDVVDVVETVGGAAVDVVETVGGGVADALEPIGTAITDTAKATGSTVGDVLEGVGDIAGYLSDEIGDAIKAGGNALEDFITPIGETVEKIAKATGSTVEDVLKGVASVGEDIIGEVGDVGQDVIDALKPLGSTIEDIAKATGSTVEDVLKGVAGVGEDILSGVGDVGQDVIDAVRASGLSTEGLLQSGLSGLASQQAAEAAAARNLALATRTTDSLFSDFKGFKTEIGGTPIELVELIQRNRA